MTQLDTDIHCTVDNSKTPYFTHSISIQRSHEFSNYMHKRNEVCTIYVPIKDQHTLPDFSYYSASIIYKSYKYTDNECIYWNRLRDTKLVTQFTSRFFKFDEVLP